MGTLVDFRAGLRLDLNDPVGASQRFSDSDLDRAVSRAVGELAGVWPRVTDTEVVLSVASRTVPLASGTFGGLIEVDEVEHPYGLAGALATYPPTLVGFRLAPDRGSVFLMVEDVPAAGARVRVRWTAAHSITVSTSSVPADLDPVVALGAAGHAMLAYSTPAADNFRYEDGATVATVDDSMIPKEWRARGQEYLGRFQAALAELRRRKLLSTARGVAWAPAHPKALWPAGE